MKKLYFFLFLSLFAFASFTHATPATIFPIEAPDAMCVGASFTCFDSTSGGIWSSSNTSVVTIQPYTGLMTAVAAGTAVITYTFLSSYVVLAVTVNPIPGPILGSEAVVVGDSVFLSDIPAGGAWTSNNTAVALADTVTGVITGVSLGTATITYMLSAGCYVSGEVNVYAAVPPISGLQVLCNYSSTVFADSATGGTWNTGDALVATVDSFSGLVTGVAPGTAIITYVLATGGYSTLEVTVNVAPIAVIGTVSMLVGDSVSLPDIPSGGTWTSSNVTIATVGTSGIVSGLSQGTAYIFDTLPDGCAATDEVAVYAYLPSITGTPGICIGSPVTFTDTIAGGSWSSSSPIVASVDGLGMVTGLGAGTATITYTADTFYVTQTVTVNIPPDAIVGSIYGINLCDDPPDPISTTLVDATPGGIWNNDTSLAYIYSTGFITINPVWLYAFYVPTDTVTYTLASGCYTTIVVNFYYCEGIPQVANTAEISIFPNPATSQLTIQSTNEAINNITITNILGQTVYTKQNVNSQQVTADCSLFPSGVYFVKVNGSEVRKFVKE